MQPLRQKFPMKYHDDNYYIDRVLGGDVSAYAQLVAKHKNLVFSIALKILNNREDAEEIAQDCFVKVFHALKTFEKKSKFSTWLYRIVYNASISKTRKKRVDLVPMDNYVINNYSEEEVNEGIYDIEPDVQKLSHQCRVFQTSCRCSRSQQVNSGKCAAGLLDAHIDAAHARNHCVPHRVMHASSMRCYWLSITAAHFLRQAAPHRQQQSNKHHPVKHSAHLLHRCSQMSRQGMNAASFPSAACKSFETDSTHTSCHAGPRNPLKMLTTQSYCHSHNS